MAGQSRCYSFSFHKKKRFSDSYRCVQCQVGGVHVRVDVIGDEFQCDPCMLPHRCIPRRWITNTVQRFLYERAQEIRKDPKYADAVVRKLWQDMLDTFPSMSDLTLEEVRALMDEFHDYGYEKRRRQIARNVEKHDRPRATLDDVPERLRTLMDGSNFLQYSSSGLYIYYSKETIKAAVDNGLTALVADGIHKLPPEELGENGQLYTIHGICNADIDVPLFHVLTRKKNVSVYAKVFGMVKQELQALGVDTTTLRIILDFEKAALAGIKRHFPMECLEGCGFHLSQAWNRRALSLGIKGDMKDIRVRKWWMTIKGLVFLPPHLHRKVPAFHRPSMPRSHHSYLKCKEFLAYLHKTWYNGPFKGIWNKWDKKELRTSNVAETYHKLLRLLMRERSAPVRKTIECLKGSDNRAMCTLRNLEKGIYRRLRKKDVERRNKIDQCMELYRQPLHQRPVSSRVISTFCRKMARFTSSKVI